MGMDDLLRVANRANAVCEMDDDLIPGQHEGYCTGELSSIGVLNGPYKFYAEIDNRLCYSVSKQLGTYENPEVEVYMECPIEEGFATLRVIIPAMDIIQRSNVSDSLLKQSMQFIQSNALDMIEVAEKG